MNKTDLVRAAADQLGGKRRRGGPGCVPGLDGPGDRGRRVADVGQVRDVDVDVGAAECQVGRNPRAGAQVEIQPRPGVRWRTSPVLAALVVDPPRLEDGQMAATRTGVAFG